MKLLEGKTTHFPRINVEILRFISCLLSALDTETVLLELSTCLSSLDLGKIETSSTTITCINKLHQRCKLISHCYDYDIRRVYLHDMKRIVKIFNLLHTTLCVFGCTKMYMCVCGFALLASSSAIATSACAEAKDEVWWSPRNCFSSDPFHESYFKHVLNSDIKFIS